MTRINEAAWRALRRPVTMTQAAKLLGWKFSEVKEKVDGYTMLTITVRRRRLLPLSELWRLREDTR